MCILIDWQRLTTIAGATSIAINQNLNAEFDIWECSVSCNVDSVSQRRWSTMCPAWSAIHWDVLVACYWEIVDSRDISPIPVAWEDCSVEIFIRKRRGNHVILEIIRISLTSLSLKEIAWILWIRRLSCVSQILSPCIFWNWPTAFGFDVQRVNSSNKSEVTFLSPITSPWVSDIPKLSAIFIDTPTYNRDGMVNVIYSCCVDINTTSVVHPQVIVCSNQTTNWSSLKHLLNNSIFSRDDSVLRYSIDLRVLLSPAFSWWIAVSAFDLWWTFNTTIPTISLISWTSLISNEIIINVLESSRDWTTMTAIVDSSTR